MTNLLYKSYNLEIGTGSKYTREIDFKFDIMLIRGKFVDSLIHKDDILNVYIAPDKIIGKTTINSSVGQLMLYVDSTTIKYLQVGFQVKITDGVNTSDLGMCLSKSADSITFENPLTHDYNSGGYIQMTVRLVDEFEFKGSGLREKIEGTENSMLLPKGTPMSITYDNITGTEKKFTFDLEILY